MHLHSKFIAIMMSLVILLSATGCSTIADMLRPSATPAPLSTSTRRPTVAGAVASTSRPTPDITLTPSPTETATPLPTVTITPSPSPSPTIDALACLLAGEAEYGIVRWVSDGDTIVVEIDETLHSVRYLGIDAPAFIPSVEYMGPVAKERNIELVEGRVVRLFKDVTERDHFGQLLRYVEVEGGVFVNFQLALEGLARVQAFPPDVACTMELQQAEQIAREALLGVWKPTPTPPPTFTPVPSATRSASPTSTPTGTPTPTLSGSITPSLTPTPTTTSSTAQATLTQSPTLTPSQGVHISTIFYDGNVANNESDEYVEIKNFGTVTVNIGGWRLNAGDAGQDYIFPDHALVSGSTCRVYTSEYHAESCGFSFVSSQAIWNNDGDCGTLYDENDQLVDEYCYP